MGPAEAGSPYAEQTRYFGEMAVIFASPERLPERLIKTLLTLEAAALDAARLDASVQRRDSMRGGECTLRIGLRP